MTVLLVLMLLVQIALLFVGVEILKELRGSRKIAADPHSAALEPDRNPAALRRPRTHSNSGFVFDAAYAIWRWRGTDWELDLGSIPAGYEPGSPPSFSGTFPAQRVKTECIRR